MPLTWGQIFRKCESSGTLRVQRPGLNNPHPLGLIWKEERAGLQSSRPSRALRLPGYRAAADVEQEATKFRYGRKCRRGPEMA